LKGDFDAPYILFDLQAERGEILDLVKQTFQAINAINSKVPPGRR